jgi:hypothetical protein
MLNKLGQTPLDITIQEGVDAALKEAQLIEDGNAALA